MSRFKKLYDSLLETEELKMMFPKMTGVWEKDKENFIKQQQQLENQAGLTDVK
jgi:hypothetical protein